MSDTRATYWSVTINNPTESDEECLANAKAKGWVVKGQEERGKKDGTPHYQLSVWTRTQQRFSALKKVFPRGHIEAARNPAALHNYVRKEETRVGDLPDLERYITSQKKLWDLVVDELYRAPKEHRITSEGEPWWKQTFEPLKALDYAGAALIRRGYYSVETMCVNPQTRSAWKTFWEALIARRELDRQTDRQSEESSSVVDIPTYETQEREDVRTTGSEESEDYEEGESETDEGYNEGSGDESSEEDSEQEY